MDDRRAYLSGGSIYPELPILAQLLFRTPPAGLKREIVENESKAGVCC